MLSKFVRDSHRQLGAFPQLLPQLQRANDAMAPQAAGNACFGRCKSLLSSRIMNPIKIRVHKTLTIFFFTLDTPIILLTLVTQNVKV